MYFVLKLLGAHIFSPDCYIPSSPYHIFSVSEKKYRFGISPIFSLMHLPFSPPRIVCLHSLFDSFAFMLCSKPVSPT